MTVGASLTMPSLPRGRGQGRTRAIATRIKRFFEGDLGSAKMTPGGWRWVCAVTASCWGILMLTATTNLFGSAALASTPPSSGEEGCIDATGRVVIPPFPNQYTTCSDQIVAVHRGDLEGFFDRHGRTVLPISFPSHYSLTVRVFEHGLEPVGEPGHVGYIDRRGVTRIPMRFARAARFLRSGHAVVEVNGDGPEGWKQALIDTSGRYLVEPRAEWVSDFAPNGLAQVRSQATGRFGYIDRSRTMRIPEQFVRAGSFTANGRAVAGIHDKMGYIDASGGFIIAPRYDWALDFGTWAPHGLAQVKINDRESFIDRHGRTIATLDPDVAVLGDFKHRLAVASDNRSRLFGFVDERGHMSIPARFDAEYGFSQDGTAAVEIDGKWGFISTAGKFVIQPQFDGAGSFGRNGLAPVAVGELWGYIDRTGRFVIAPRYAYAYSHNDNGLALVKIVAR